MGRARMEEVFNKTSATSASFAKHPCGAVVKYVINGHTIHFS